MNVRQTDASPNEHQAQYHLCRATHCSERFSKSALGSNPLYQSQWQSHASERIEQANEHEKSSQLPVWPKGCEPFPIQKFPVAVEVPSQ